MKKNIRSFTLFACTFFATIILWTVTSSADDSQIFVIPDVLVDNVAFWKIVYTDLSLKEGVLHDREYPMLIYDRFTVGDNGYRVQESISRSHREKIVAALRTMAIQPDSTLWDEPTRAIARKYLQKAPMSSIGMAENRIRFQLGQKERFKAGLERSGAFLDTIRTIFAQYGIPQRVTLLPHVESSFNTEAYSKVGAAGMWQFMRYTGRIYMRIDYLIDERRDPVIATVAAAKLLRHNYDELGSWPLAITAYNHGLNGMKRATIATGSNDISVILKNYSSESFQFASKNFYACFLAATDVAMDPQRYFPTISLHQRLQRRDLKLTSYMKPRTLARYLGITETELERYNLSLRPVVFTQQRLIPAGYTIHFPATVELASIEKNLASLPESLRIDKPDQSQYYRVQSGDNLSAIAAMLQTTPSVLAKENNLTLKSRIFAGQILTVPPSGSAPRVSATPPVVAVTQNTSPKINKPSTPLPLPVPTAAPAPSTSSLEEVPEGMEPPLPFAQNKNEPPATSEGAPAAPATSLGMLTAAETLSTTEDASMRPQSTVRFDADVYGLDAVIGPGGSTASIRVSIDETIGHYADWLKIPSIRIRELNRIGSRAVIRIGQRITLPIRAVSLEDFVKTRLEYHMAIEEDFYSQFKVTDTKEYTIKRGEALWDICNGENAIPLWLFKKYNKHLDLSTLMPGTSVWMPVVEEKTDADTALEQGERGGIYRDFEPVLPNRPMQRRMP